MMAKTHLWCSKTERKRIACCAHIPTKIPHTNRVGKSKIYPPKELLYFLCCTMMAASLCARIHYIVHSKRTYIIYFDSRPRVLDIVSAPLKCYGGAKIGSLPCSMVKKTTTTTTTQPTMQNRLFVEWRGSYKRTPHTLASGWATLCAFMKPYVYNSPLRSMKTDGSRSSGRRWARAPESMTNVRHHNQHIKWVLRNTHTFQPSARRAIRITKTNTPHFTK